MISWFLNEKVVLWLTLLFFMPLSDGFDWLGIQFSRYESGIEISQEITSKFISPFFLVCIWIAPAIIVNLAY